MSLEVLYEIGTREVRGWCGDSKQFGDFKPKVGQAVVVFSINVEDIVLGEDYMVDLDAKTVYPARPHVPSPDFKAQWRVATTPETKLVVLGKILGLEDKG